MTPELKIEIATLTGFPEDDVTAAGMVIAASKHVAIAGLLKSRGYTLYLTVVASHWPLEAPSKAYPEGRAEFFEVATVLRQPTMGAALFSWRVKLSPGETLETLYPLFAGADWQEREQFDLVGIRFKGHPDLRRLMMPEDWIGHPLRKDYAIETAHSPWR